MDYAMPAAAALLELFSENGVQVSSALSEAQDSSSLSCVMKVS
jgi:hypothetical protein